ncbi:MAG: SDR family oxidoreductase [Planctomycetes bacterium]|nr:SDR family oxidoreductase [Planctomycetota bacterium]
MERGRDRNRPGREGHQLRLWSRNEEPLRELIFELGKCSQHSFTCVDLGREDQVRSACQNLAQEASLRAIVHVAAAPWRAVGVEEPGNVTEFTAHWRVAVGGFVQLCTHLMPRLGSGSTITAVSTNLTMGAPPEQASAYVSSKMALEGYIKSLALELGPRGIRANIVSPSLLNTSYTRDIPPRKKMVEAARNPLRRLCEPEDVAEAVVHILSPRAAFINGALIPVTGGISMP